MGIIKEPKDVDLSTKSEPWTDQELADFRKLMHDIKTKNSRRKKILVPAKSKKKIRV